MIVGIVIGVVAGVVAGFLIARRRPWWPKPKDDPVGREQRDIEELIKVFMAETESTFVLVDSDLRVVDISHVADFPEGTRKEDLIGKLPHEIMPVVAVRKLRTVRTVKPLRVVVIWGKICVAI